MALTYEKVIGVISQPPSHRKDFEVNNLLSWFRKKSDLFKNLKTDLLFDIIKNLQFVTKQRDDIVIKQGDKGDCMYILLRGKVNIYILYNKTEDDDKPPPPAGAKQTSESIRAALGTFVCPLGPGATFGEVALLKEDDCVRTASIIAEEPTDLIVVDRALYNRSVKNVLKKEFEDKTNFIANNPYFKTWPPKYKKQLAMALQIENVPYDGMLTRQGELVSDIYFILSGEIKIVMDPSQHKSQYPKLDLEEDTLPAVAPNGEIKMDEEEEEDLLARLNSGTSSKNGTSANNSMMKFKKKCGRKEPREVCLLGVNESIGDIEVLLDLDSYMQNAKCTQKCEVLVLEMKHYERLLVKRNPRTIELMKEQLSLRLKTRTSKQIEKRVPLMRCLFQQSVDYVQQKIDQNEARNNTNINKQVRTKKTMSESFESFVPAQGALVDMYGPGTVFHKIREREKARIVKQQRNRKLFGGGPSFGGVASTGISSSKSDSGVNGGISLRATSGAAEQRFDPVLEQLENRMRAWLQAENPNARLPPPRVAKLHRPQTESDQVKPGVKVVLRPKETVQPVTPPGVNTKAEVLKVEDEEEEEYIMTGSAWGSTIERYRRVNCT